MTGRGHTVNEQHESNLMHAGVTADLQGVCTEWPRVIK